MNTISKRTVAFIIDSGLIATVTTILSLCLSLFVPRSEVGFNWQYYLLSGITAIGILFKDLLFRNASIGKRLLGLCIVSENGTTPSIKSLILRNASLVVLSGIEALLYLFRDEERIGDKLAHTKVVEVTIGPGN